MKYLLAVLMADKVTIDIQMKIPKFSNSLKYFKNRYLIEQKGQLKVGAKKLSETTPHIKANENLLSF